ncbi:MAG: SidA/IucD/PvdA family monooxygenase, partial [Chloroflexota bacterium]
HYGLEHRHVATHIERVSREGDHFVLRSEHGETIGRARHVLLALGHGEWRWPEVCAQQSARLELTGLLYHSYQPKQYPADTVVVVGAGMAAMNEWVNVLRHGGRLIVVHRGRRLMEQALSAPRCSFSGPWLDRYHQMSPEDRGEVLSALSRGTVPRSGRRIIRQARDEGRIQLISGEIAGIERIGDRVSMNVRELGSGHLETIEGAMMIAATGFQSSWEDIPILRDLVEEQGVTVCGTLLKLEDDCSVPVVSQLESSVALSGPLSRWAYPPADSLAGMKYAGRRFAARVTGSNGPTVPAWWRMVRAGWARSGPQQDGESCASR